MKFFYDRVGDILYVDFVDQYAEQESDMISDSVVARTNPVTERVESLEILFFSELQASGNPLELPVRPDLVPEWATIDFRKSKQPARKPKAS
jgi:hypothetical protein